MEQIRKYLERTFKLTDEDWMTFSSKLARQEFPKKNLLLKVGQTENHLSFIEKGIIRFYIYGSIKHLDIQKATFDGNGLNYLWFRIPLQILFIVWTYLSSIKN